jgi:protocatechuate 3,4-dioxygenase alpha subunit
VTNPLPYLKETPSQTAGPYVHIGLMPAMVGTGTTDGPPLGAAIAGPATAGTRIRVEGTIHDGLGEPVRDAIVEIWQADGAGRHADGSGDFRGWGRVAADLDTGVFGFETVKPGAVTGHDGRPMAPHLTLWIVARGINIGLHTRLYFPDEDNSADPLLARIDPPGRRATLIAVAEGPGRYRFDIRLQGEGETVFLDI